MRKTLVMLLCLAALCSCSSDGEDSVDFLASEIVLTPQYSKRTDFGVCQIHEARVDVEEPGVSYVWSFRNVEGKDEGFTSSESSISWWPQVVGKYIVRVVLSKGGKEKELARSVEVVAGAGFGFYGQPMSDIVMNETMYFLTNYGMEPDMSMYQEKFDGKSYTILYFTDMPKGKFRKYYFIDNALQFCLWSNL